MLGELVDVILDGWCYVGHKIPLSLFDPPVGEYP